MSDDRISMMTEDKKAARQMDAPDEAAVIQYAKPLQNGFNLEAWTRTNPQDARYRMRAADPGDAATSPS
jgi:hypothetical protein